MPDTAKPAPVDLPQLVADITKRLEDSGQHAALAQFREFLTAVPAKSEDSLLEELLEAGAVIDRLGAHIREQDIRLSTQSDAIAELEAKFTRLLAEARLHLPQPVAEPGPATPAVEAPK